MNKYLPALLFAMLVFAGCKNSNKETTSILSFNLQKGKTYEYVLDWKLDQKMMERTSRVSVVSNYLLNVISDDGKLINLTVTYDRFRLAFDMAGMQAEVDTEKPLPSQTLPDGSANPALMMAEIFQGVKGQQFTMQVDKAGNVISVGGLNEIVKAIVSKNTTLSEQQRLQWEMSLRDQFNETAIREAFASVLSIFPVKEVKVGDSWDKSYTLQGKLPGQYKSTYVVKEIKGEDITLDVKTGITPEAGTNTVVTGQQTGTLHLNLKTGLLQQANYQQDFNVKNPDYGMTIKGTGVVTGREK